MSNEMHNEIKINVNPRLQNFVKDLARKHSDESPADPTFQGTKEQDPSQLKQILIDKDSTPS